MDKPKLYIVNAFSLNMLPQEFDSFNIDIYKIPIDYVKEYIRNEVRDYEIVSAIGHESTAKLLSKILGIEIKANRIPIKIGPFDKLLVFQLLTRLPEGKILNDREIEELFKEGKAAFYEIEVTLYCPNGGPCYFCYEECSPTREDCKYCECPLCTVKKQ